jgi:hypothetical protein
MAEINQISRKDSQFFRKKDRSESGPSVSFKNCQTHLPDKGIIYLCKDEKQNDITVMLIDDEKMYLYNDSKRFLINFNEPVAMGNFQKSYVDAD